MKALEIDAVVDHADLLARHAVQRLDLTLPTASDGGDGRCAREDPSLEGEHEPMIEPARAATSGGQVSAMASLTRAIDLLAERSLVALHEVPPAPSHEAPGRRDEDQQANRCRQRWQCQPVNDDAGECRLLTDTQ